MATDVGDRRRLGTAFAEQRLDTASMGEDDLPTLSLVSRLVQYWLPLTMVTLLIGGLGVRVAGPITDPDPWWHLRLGHEFRGDWSLSAPGSLSPFAEQPWVATQWTLEVAASYLVGWAGLGAVPWLAGLGVILLGAALWLGNRSRSGPLASAMATSAALLGTLPVLAPRPQVASLVLLAIVGNAWWKTTADLRPRWWLIPLGWLWACTHGFWFIGVLLGFAVVAGLAMDGRLSQRKGLLLLSIPGCSLLVAAVTPAGPHLLLAPFKVNGIADRIQEWQPPSFHEPLVLVVAMMLAAVLITNARLGNASWAELAVVLLAGMLLVYAARSVALAAVLLSPLLATTLQGWVGSTSRRPRRSERWLVGVGLALAVVALSFTTVLRAPYTHPFPEAIDDALAGLPEGTVVYNDYKYGGLLSWEHQHLVHGIDGMTEAYAPQYLDAYLDAGLMLPGWREFLDVELDADAAFLPADDPLALELSGHLDWTTLAKTDEYVVLRRP